MPQFTKESFEERKARFAQPQTQQQPTQAIQGPQAPSGFWGSIKGAATWSNVKKLPKGIAEFTAPLGTTIGTAVSPYVRVGTPTIGGIKFSGINKYQQQATDQKLKLQKQLLAAYRKEKNPERKKKLASLMQESDIPSFFEGQEYQKTPTQIAGEAGITAMSAGLGLGILGKGVGAAAKLAPSTKLGKLGVDVAAGGAFGLAEAARRDKGGTGMAKEAAVGAAANVLIPRVGGKILGIGFKGLKKSGALFGKSYAGGMEKAGEYAVKGKAPTKEGTMVDKISAPVWRDNQTMLQKGAEKIVSFDKKVRGGWKQAMIDRFDSVAQWQRSTMNVLGKEIKIGDRPWERLRMANDIGYGRAKNFQKKLEKTLVKGNEDIYPEIVTYLKAKDGINRINLGQKQAFSKEEYLQGIKEIEQTMGPEDMKRVLGAAEDYRILNDEVLNYRIPTGLTSKESAEVYKRKYKDYVNHQVLKYADDEGVRVGGKSFNVGKNGIFKAKGSAEEIEDPILSLMDNAQRTFLVGEQNLATKKMIDMARMLPENSGFKALRKSEDVQKRFQLIEEIKEYRGLGKQLEKGLQETKKGEKAVEGKITKIADKKDPVKIVALEKKEKVLDAETETLFAEARTLSADWESKTSINQALGKLAGKEKALYKTQGRIAEEKTILNQTKFESVVQEKQAMEDLRLLEKTLGKQKAEQELATKELQENINSLRDIKMKKVDTPDGFEKVEYFNDGIKEEWLVPEDLGRAVKGMNEVETGIAMKLLSAPATVLRAGATSMNLAFMLPNIFRDIQTALVVSKHGLTPKGWAASVASIVKDDALYKEFVEEGASMSGFIGANETKRRLVKDLSKSKTMKVADSMNPAKWLRGIAEVSENSTRAAVYKQAKAKGMSKAAAAFEARNASVDFARMGTAMRQINRVVPFINARTQGLVNTVTSLTKDPTKFLRTQMYTAAWPAMNLYAMNNEYESYDLIDQREKDKYFIFMVGEHEGVDDEGVLIKVPNYMKIPKGESQQLVANSIETFLDYGKKKGSRSVSKLLADLAIGTSPIAPDLSFTGPLSAPFEWGANYDLFKRRAIDTPTEVEENLSPKYRYDDGTPMLAKNIGEALNVSPRKVEFLTGKLFGGLGSDLLKVPDLVIEGPKPKSGIQTPTVLDDLSVIPVVRSFVGSSNYAEMVKFYDVSDDTSRISADSEFLIDQQAEAFYQTFKVLPPGEGDKKVEEIEDEYVKQKVYDIAEYEQKGWDYIDRGVNRKGVMNGERALFIYKWLNELEYEDQQKFLNSLAEKGIATDTVSAQVNKMIEEFGQPQ